MLGARLVRDPVGGLDARTGRIVEVEAYIGADDRASHARFGRTARNGPMFGEAGHAYVYLVYGMYLCLNVVTQPTGEPAAVLIRAVEPLEGIAAMRASRVRAELRLPRHRGSAGPELSAAIRARIDAVPVGRLASGPGLVGAAFDLDVTMSGLDLLDPQAPLRLERAPAGEAPPSVAATTRVGVGYAGAEWATVPWRFVVRGHPSVSAAPREA